MAYVWIEDVRIHPVMVAEGRWGLRRSYILGNGDVIQDEWLDFETGSFIKVEVGQGPPPSGMCGTFPGDEDNAPIWVLQEMADEEGGE